MTVTSEYKDNVIYEEINDVCKFYDTTHEVIMTIA